jgi:hypothetical protein
MANNGKVTSLAFVLTTENGSKNITTAEFNFSGDISVNQAAKLVDHFKGLASGINDNETKNVPVSNNIPDTIGIPVSNNVTEMKNEETDSDDELHEVISDEETDSDDELHEVISDDEGLNMRGRHLSHMLYPIRGIPILLDNVRNYKSHILKAWKTYSSVLVKSSEIRNMYGHQLTHYRVVFPALKVDTFPFSFQENMGINSLLHVHSYPVCSCPAYHFKSYRRHFNNRLVTGLCKHIELLLQEINIDISKITWENRPDNLPLLLKNEGLNEYKWIPQPVIQPVIQPVVQPVVEQNVQPVQLVQHFIERINTPTQNVE